MVGCTFDFLEKSVFLKHPNVHICREFYCKVGLGQFSFILLVRFEICDMLWKLLKTTILLVILFVTTGGLYDYVHM